MNKNYWEKNLNEFSEANFLQSWEWGEFHQKLGHPVYRVKFSARGGGGMFQGVVEPARRGRYLEIPGGPLLSNYASVSLWKQAISLMKEVAKKESCVFIRIRPQVSDTFHTLGFRPAPMHLHAELTRVLDLTKTDEQLLVEMRKSTRYEIKKAIKTGIKVEQSEDENLINDFVRLQNETSAREKFVPFSKKYLQEQFKAFRKTNSARWFLIRPGLAAARPGLYRSGEETPGKISMAFVIFYRGEAVYHYAASNAASRLIPAAYAIQWAIIQEAKKRGCKTYNLWGDVADDQLGSHRFSTHHSAHRFAGPSMFKRGFGGNQVAYLHAQDLPLKKTYWLNYLVEIVRKKYRLL